LKKAIRSAGTKHAALKNEAQMGQGFDRHIFGMKKRAEQAGIEILRDVKMNKQPKNWKF